jgi:hypothetical protein
VLHGTVYVAFGNRFDPSSGVSMPPGSVYVLPANQPHYVWAGETGVIYQESGTAPTGTTFIAPPPTATPPPAATAPRPAP